MTEPSLSLYAVCLKKCLFSQRCAEFFQKHNFPYVWIKSESTKEKMKKAFLQKTFPIVLALPTATVAMIGKSTTRLLKDAHEACVLGGWSDFERDFLHR